MFIQNKDALTQFEFVPRWANKTTNMKQLDVDVSPPAEVLKLYLILAQKPFDLYPQVVPTSHLTSIFLGKQTERRTECDAFESIVH